jgi:hypothetical protein
MTTKTICNSNSKESDGLKNEINVEFLYKMMFIAQKVVWKRNKTVGKGSSKDKTI